MNIVVAGTRISPRVHKTLLCEHNQYKPLTDAPSSPTHLFHTQRNALKMFLNRRSSLHSVTTVCRRNASSLELTKEGHGRRQRAEYGKIKSREREAAEDEGRVAAEKHAVLRSAWERDFAGHQERQTTPTGRGSFNPVHIPTDTEQLPDETQLNGIEELRARMANKSQRTRRSTRTMYHKNTELKQEVPKEEEYNPFADGDDIPGSAKDKFVDAEIMKMESRVIKAATRRDARRQLHAVTTPSTDLFKFNGKMVPPPPSLTNILVPSAVALGKTVYVDKKWELVYQGGPYDVYLDSGPQSASEVAIFGGAGSGKSTLINAITESKIANMQASDDGVPTIDFYQAPDRKLWKQAWADGPTKYPAATRLSRTHWGGALIDLPGHTAGNLRPDAEDAFYMCISQYYEGTRRQLKGTFYCVDATKGFTVRDKKWLRALSDMHTRVSLVTIVITKADLLSHKKLEELMKNMYREISSKRHYALKINLPIIPVSSVYGWGIEQLRGFLVTQAELLPWWKRVEEQRDIVEKMQQRGTEDKEQYLEERVNLVSNFKKLDKWQDRVHQAINSAEYGSPDEAQDAEYALVKLEKEQSTLGMHLSGMGARHNPLIRNPYLQSTVAGGAPLGPGMSPTTVDEYVRALPKKASGSDMIIPDEGAAVAKKNAFVEKLRLMEEMTEDAVQYPNTQQRYQKDFFERQMGEFTDARRGVAMFSPTYLTDPEVSKDDWETLSAEALEEKVLRGSPSDDLVDRMNYGFTLDDISEEVTTKHTKTLRDAGISVDESPSSHTQEPRESQEQQHQREFDISADEVIEEEEEQHNQPHPLSPPTRVGYNWLFPRGIGTGQFSTRLSFTIRGAHETTTTTTSTSTAPDITAGEDLADDILSEFGITDTIEAPTITEGTKPTGYSVVSNMDSFVSQKNTTEPRSGDAVLAEQGRRLLRANETAEETLAREADVYAEEHLPLRRASGEKNTISFADGVDATYDAAAKTGMGFAKPDQTLFKDTPVRRMGGRKALPRTKGVEEGEGKEEEEEEGQKKRSVEGGEHQSPLPRPSQKWKSFTQLLRSVPGDVLLEAQPVDPDANVFKNKWTLPTVGLPTKMTDGLGKNNEPTMLDPNVISEEIKKKQMGPHYMGYVVFFVAGFLGGFGNVK